MKNITIVMRVDEVNFVLQVLGELKTSSGAFPLMMNIKAQADKQVSEPPAKVEENTGVIK